MIAKIIVHGRDRREAIARMKRVLEMTVIEGIKTSIPLHRWLMAHPDVRSGQVDTGWLEREWRANGADALREENLETAAIAAALLVDGRRSAVVSASADHAVPGADSAWRLAARQAALH